MTISLPLALAGDAVVLAVGYAWGRGWLQKVPSLLKTAKATVATVEDTAKQTVEDVKKDVQ